jgi:hypothetical protein
MVGSRRRYEADVWVSIEGRAPRWAVWCVVIGVLLMAASAVAALVVVVR